MKKQSAPTGKIGALLRRQLLLEGDDPDTMPGGSGIQEVLFLGVLSM